MVISNGSDVTTDRVVGYLAKRTAYVLRLNTEEFPEQVGLSLHFRDDVDAHILVIGGERVPLDCVNAVWVRRPWAPEASPNLGAEDRDFAARESAHVLRGIWHLLGDRFWVNPRPAEMSAEHKPYQLALAAEIGFEVPRTLITNSPTEAVQFFERCGGRMIFKALGSYYYYRNEQPPP
ncbi:MAG: MvdC/MvdD family ATP grasp protein [Gemmataceae bacterium]